MRFCRVPDPRTFVAPVLPAPPKKNAPSAGEGRFDTATAIKLAKFQRPIVDPFGQLHELLVRLEQAYTAKGRPPIHADAEPPASS